MTIKIIASLFIILSGFLAGNEMGKRLEKRAAVFDKLWYSLLHIKSSITGPALALPRIYEELGRKKDYDVAEFFLYLAQHMDSQSVLPEEAWRNGIEQYLYCLSKEEKEFISSRGGRIGCSGRAAQIEELDAFMEHILQKKHISEQIRDKKAGMYRSLGFFAGLSAAIMLL